jgi:hypothetical protein
MTLSSSTVAATPMAGMSSTGTIRATDNEGRFKDASLTFAVSGDSASAALTSPATVHSVAPSPSPTRPTGSTATQSCTFPISVAPAVTFAGTPTAAPQDEVYSTSPPSPPAARARCHSLSPGLLAGPAQCMRR